MSRHDDNIRIFDDTIEMLTGNATLSGAVKNSIERQQLYPEGSSKLAAFTAEGSRSGNVAVSKKRTFEAAAAYKGKKVCVLNFASASNPGGGVVNGANAQEECLCRCSTLYPCLNTKENFAKFYKPHRAAHDPLHNDDIIYTPDVVVFKSDTAIPETLAESEWYKVDVITCAAPNLRRKPSNMHNTGDGDRAVKITDNALLQLHEKRMTAVLKAAALNNADVVILGAFGCGAFENSPFVVAQAMRNVTEKLRHCFDTIEFAVYCSPRDDSNFRAFNTKLGRM